MAEQREAFRGRIADLAGGVDGLVQVHPGRGMVAPLGGVPDELAHQDGRFGLDGVQLAPDPAAGGVGGQEAHLPQALADPGEQR